MARGLLKWCASRDRGAQTSGIAASPHWITLLLSEVILSRHSHSSFLSFFVILCGNLPFSYVEKCINYTLINALCHELLLLLPKLAANPNLVPDIFCSFPVMIHLELRSLCLVAICGLLVVNYCNYATILPIYSIIVPVHSYSLKEEDVAFVPSSWNGLIRTVNCLPVEMDKEREREREREREVDETGARWTFPVLHFSDRLRTVCDPPCIANSLARSDP